MHTLKTCAFAALAFITPTATALAAGGMEMSPPKACTLTDTQKSAMLAANYNDFDQSLSATGSWRPLVNEGCYEAAADIISRYLEKHRATLCAEDVWTLNFHAGQTLAMGGKDAASIPWFEKSRDPTAGAEWLAYVDATLAFLKKDQSKLTAARAAYLAATSANAPRLKVIDGFIACLTKPYMQAMMCEPTH